MELLNPLALFGLAAVAIAATVALFRPARQVAIISHLRLWERAIEATDPRARRQRTVTVSWMLLLAGALVAVFAAGRLIWVAQQPSRYICITLIPSAELYNDPGKQQLHDAAGALLDRLGPYDRVRLILPTRMGGATEVLTRNEAIVEVAKVQPLLVKAGDLSIPPADGEAQHAYRIGPATLARQDGPKATDILLPTSTPDVTLDALAATRLTDDSSQLLLAVINHTDDPADVKVALRFDADDQPERTVRVAARQRRVEILTCPAEVSEVTVAIGEAIGQSGTLALVERPDVSVAMIGRDNPFVRRFLRAMPGTVAAIDPATADTILAIGTRLPTDRPGLAMASPMPPPRLAHCHEVVAEHSLTRRQRLERPPPDAGRATRRRRRGPGPAPPAGRHGRGGPAGDDADRRPGRSHRNTGAGP